MLKNILTTATIVSIIFLSACIPPQSGSTDQSWLQKERELIRLERELIQRERELIQAEHSLIQRERSLAQRRIANQNPSTSVVGPITTGPTSGFPRPDRPQASVNGDILIRIEPCVTPTVVADYRDLLPAGTYSYSRDMVFYIKGYDILGQATPTPPPHFNDSPPVFIDPLSARIVYTTTSFQSCD